MNKFDMINQMAKMIEADPSLDVSEWQATFNFADGELVSKELVDLNAIEFEGMPERAPGDMTAVELSVMAAANCYVTSLFLLAYNEKMPIEKAEIVFTGKFAKAPFLGLTEGYTGISDPTLVLTAESSAPTDEFNNLATRAFDRSPVLSSLNAPVAFTIN